MGRKDNHLFLKPKAAQVATNLTVLTSRRHYQFDYVALSQRPAADDLGVIYALRFTYAPPPAQSRPTWRRSGSNLNWKARRPSDRKISTIGIAASVPSCHCRIR